MKSIWFKINKFINFKSSIKVFAKDISTRKCLKISPNCLSMANWTILKLFQWANLSFLNQITVTSLSQDSQESAEGNSKWPGYSVPCSIWSTSCLTTGLFSAFTCITSCPCPTHLLSTTIRYGAPWLQLLQMYSLSKHVEMPAGPDWPTLLRNSHSASISLMSLSWFLIYCPHHLPIPSDTQMHIFWQPFMPFQFLQLY